MKKILSALLVILTLLSCLPALAETEDAEILKRDRDRIRWGMAMVAEMAGCAVDQLENAGNDGQRALLTRFSGVDYLSPDKAIVLEFKEALI